MDIIISIVTLLVAIITLYVSFMAYRHVRTSDIMRKKQEIACKEAELKILSSTNHFIDSTTMNNTIIRKSVLETEIEILKKKL